MTPAEKAKQLVQRFYLSLPNNGSFTGLNNINRRWEEGKNCALIAVDEIIKALRKDLPEIGLGKGYWYDVKQEIEKL